MRTQSAWGICTLGDFHSSAGQGFVQHAATLGAGMELCTFLMWHLPPLLVHSSLSYHTLPWHFWAHVSMAFAEAVFPDALLHTGIASAAVRQWHKWQFTPRSPAFPSAPPVQSELTARFLLQAGVMLSSHLTDAPLSPHTTRDIKVGILLGICWSNLLSCSEFIPILFLSPQHLSCFHDTLDSVTNICCILFVLSPFPRGRSVWNIKFLLA